MQIKDIKLNEINRFFLEDPALCYLGLSDNDLHHLYKNKSYKMDINSIYKSVYLNNELISVVKYELFTEFTLNAHFYITTKNQKKGLALKIQNLLYNYFLDEYPHMIKVVTPVPSSCTHVQKCAEKFGMKVEGCLTKCMKWRGEFVDLLLYSIELKRD